MATIQWFADNIELSQSIIDALPNEFRNTINISLTEELELSLSHIRNNVTVIQCSNAHSKVFSSDIIKDFLENESNYQKVIFLIPIGYCTENSGKAVTDFISTVIMYDKISIIAHSFLCISPNEVHGIFREENRETDCIQPITFNELSDIISNALNPNFNHVLVYAVGKKTFAPTKEKSNSLLSRLTNQNKKSAFTPYITPKRYDTGITDLILQDSSDQRKKTILHTTVTE